MRLLTPVFVTWTIEKSPPTPKSLLVSRCQLRECISKVFGIPWETVMGKCRKSEIVEARFMYFYILNKWYSASYMSLGRDYHKDHTSIMNACRQAGDHLSSKDPSWDGFKEKHDKLKSLIF